MRSTFVVSTLVLALGALLPSVGRAQSFVVDSSPSSTEDVTAVVDVLVNDPGTGVEFSPDPVIVGRGDTVRWFISAAVFMAGETEARVESVNGPLHPFMTPYAGPGQPDIVKFVVPVNAPQGTTTKYRIRFQPGDRTIDPDIVVVPALGSWGLAGLVTLLLTSGVLALRRRVREV